MQMCCDTFLQPDDGKKTKTKAVKYKERHPKIFLHRFEDHGNYRSQKDDAPGYRVMHPEHRHVQQYIPDGPAAHRRDERDNNDAKGIKIFLHGREGPRHGKGDGSGDFYGEIKLFVQDNGL